jgi:hypothetical protein
MRFKSITGLEENEIEVLVERIDHILDGQNTQSRRGKGGRPPLLTLTQQVALTLFMLRKNVTQEVAADRFGISQSRASEIKSRVEPLLDKALAFTGIPLGQATKHGALIVDGTYIPTGNREQTGRTNYSHKRGCQCLSIQVASRLDGGLVAVSDPVPGSRHDAAAIEMTGWAATLADANWVADTAYQATNAITPKRKPRDHPRSESDKEYNRQVSSIRAAVERCISHLKNWRILKTGYRRQLKHLPRLIALVVKLELYRLGW